MNQMTSFFLSLLLSFNVLAATGNGEVVETNTTKETIAASAFWLGEFDSSRLFPSLFVEVLADQNVEVCVIFSHLAVAAEEQTCFDATAGNSQSRVFNTGLRFFRVKVTNQNSVSEAEIRVHSALGYFNKINQNSNTSLGVDYQTIAVRPTNFTDEVVTNRRSGVRPFTKFGYREGLTAANGEETIWATSGNFTPLTSPSTFTITFNNTTDGAGTTGAESLYFDYIDENGLYATVILALDSSGSQVTPFSGFGINRVAVVDSGSAEVNTNEITITATTGGSTQAVVPALQGVTQQAIYHNDANSYGVAKFLWWNINKLSGGGTPRVLIKAYIFNRTYSTRFEVFRALIDTSTEATASINEPVGFRLSPRDVLYFVADTDTNTTTVNLRFSLLEYKID